MHGVWSVRISLLIQMGWLYSWRKRYHGLRTRILAENNGLKLKTPWWTWSNMHLFTRRWIMYLSGVDYLWIIVMFYQLSGLSFWRHPFTAEDPSVSKWCNTTFLQICSQVETNSSTPWMAWGRVHFQQISIFGWTIPLISFIIYKTPLIKFERHY